MPSEDVDFTNNQDFFYPEEYQEEILEYKYNIDSLFIETDSSHIEQSKLNEEIYILTKIIEEKKSPRANLSNDEKTLISRTVLEESADYDNIDPVILMALITQESRFIKEARSHAGARGLGQVTVNIAKVYCDSNDIPYVDGMLYDIETNIKVATWFLNYCINKHKGDLELALAHYNGGPRNAWRYYCYRKIMNKKSTTTLEIIGAGRLPQETRNYVESVVSRINKISKLTDDIKLAMQD